MVNEIPNSATALPAQPEPLGQAKSVVIRESDRSPRMTHHSLTIVLAVMCIIPVIIIGVLWSYMPPVFEKQLKAEVSAANLPAPEHYDIPLADRPELPSEGLLLVTNVGEKDWTQYNILINMQFAGSYQIYEHHEPIPAGQTKEFNLSSFVSRSGARFDLRYNPLKNVQIYARLPDASRATYYYSFETNSTDD